VIADRDLSRLAGATPTVPEIRRESLRGNAALRIGLAIVIVLLALTMAAPVMSPYDPLSTGPAMLERPSLLHPMGTDALGRDLLTRVLFGARVSLGAAMMTLLLIVTAGITLGLLSGYYGGWADAFVMRLADVVISVPTLILALAVVGFFGAGLPALVFALSGVWWVRYARLTRGLVLTGREHAFVEAARALGAGDSRILLRHILPQIMRSVLVLATLDVGNVVLAVSGLTFLGMGAQPPTPEWGAMINEGKDVLFVAPHVMLFPGLTLSLAVLGCNLLGEGLADEIGDLGSRTL